MKTILTLLLLQLMTGCSLLSSPNEGDKNSALAANSSNALNQEQQSIHYYAKQLAEQFFTTSENININKTIAVGTFLPINNLNGNTLPQANPIAHQLQESFITIAAQVGLKVVEFKTMSQLKIKNNQDIMLSRNIEELAPSINADYYLTGTYSEHKNKLVVNIRLIELPSNIVVAAATDYIPADVMEHQSEITFKNNHLYRGAN